VPSLVLAAPHASGAREMARRLTGTDPSTVTLLAPVASPADVLAWLEMLRTRFPVVAPSRRNPQFVARWRP
jgi:hypothetical protein